MPSFDSLPVHDASQWVAQGLTETEQSYAVSSREDNYAGRILVRIETHRVGNFLIPCIPCPEIYIHTVYLFHLAYSLPFIYWAERCLGYGICRIDEIVVSSL